MSDGPGTMLTTPAGRSACWTTSANRSALSGVVEAGLSTTVFPAARAGAIFQASIRSGKFQGMTWAATPSGFATRPGESVFELVRPAGVVPEVVRGERDVDVAQFLDRLARVHRLEDRELAAALLEDPRDPEQVLGALAARQVAPARPLRAARRADRLVDVGRRGLRDLRDDLLGRGIDAAGRRRRRWPGPRGRR